MSGTQRDLADVCSDIVLGPAFDHSLKGSFYMPAREAKFVPVPSHLLTGGAGLFVQHDARTKTGIYSHQGIGLNHLFNGDNVCLTTTTGSGKSLVPILHALYKLDQNPNARFLYVSPAKALQTDQKDSWLHALQLSGHYQSDRDIGIVNGDEKDDKIRLQTVQDAKILFITPDTRHRWLMASLKKPEVRNFMANLGNEFLDELHVYNGIFGSHFALSEKRFQFAVDAIKRQESGRSRRAPDPMQIIAASASLRDATAFAKALTGRDFKEVGRDQDGSPKYTQDVANLEVHEAEQLSLARFLIMQFLKAGETAKPGMGITFIYDRQGVEKMAAEINARLGKEAVTSFRAGYSAGESEDVMAEIRYGKRRWVICTPVAEMGIDFQDMAVGMSVGRPISSTSLPQQIGRVGRHRDAFFVVLAPPRTFGPDGSPTSIREHAHGNVATQKLHPELPRLLGGHALCLAREIQDLGLPAAVSLNEARYSWGNPFNETMTKLRAGERFMDPDMEDSVRNLSRRAVVWGLFGLRDLELGQPHTLRARMPDGTVHTLGTLTRPQALREAYEEAIFLHRGQRLRVDHWGWHKEDKMNSRAPVIHLVPAGDPHVVTRPIIERNIYLPQKLRAMPGSRSFVNAAGRIMEIPLTMKEETVGFYRHRPKVDASTTASSERYIYAMAEKEKDEGAEKRYRHIHYADTSGVLIDFRRDIFTPEETDQVAGLIRDRYCEMSGIPHGSIQVASTRILQTTRDKPVEIPHAIVIYDRGSNKLRLTDGLIAKLPEIIQSMAEDRGLIEIRAKLSAFHEHMTFGRTAKQAPRTAAGRYDDLSGGVDSAATNGERSDAIYRVRDVVWFDGSFKSAEKRKRGASQEWTQVRIEEFKKAGDQTLYRIEPWDNPAQPKIAVAPTAKGERWVPSTRLFAERPANLDGTPAVGRGRIDPRASQNNASL